MAPSHVGHSGCDRMIDAECWFCRKIKPFTDRDREELGVMLNDLFQSVATLKVQADLVRKAKHPSYRSRGEIRLAADRLERDLFAFRDRLTTDGEEYFEPDVPF